MPLPHPPEQGPTEEQSHEGPEKIRRRSFFRRLGGTAAVAGVLGALRGERADAYDAQAVPNREKSNAVRTSEPVRVEWLGHGSFLFESSNGKVILLDPWLETNPTCPGRYKKQKGFDRVDLILWTHGHVDHFMLPDAKRLIAEYNPLVVAPWELCFFIKEQIPSANTQIFQLGNKGATAPFLDGIMVTMVEAFHSAGAQLTGFQGTNRYVGEATGYIVTFENGLKIYHSGDTSLMGDMKTVIGAFYQPDIAILPIGGVFTMGPDEAAYGAKLISPRIVIPEHFGTFPVLEQDTKRFRKALKIHAPDVQVVELAVGTPVPFSK